MQPASLPIGSTPSDPAIHPRPALLRHLVPCFLVTQSSTHTARIGRKWGKTTSATWTPTSHAKRRGWRQRRQSWQGVHRQELKGRHRIKVPWKNWTHLHTKSQNLKPILSTSVKLLLTTKSMQRRKYSTDMHNIIVTNFCRMLLEVSNNSRFVQSWPGGALGDWRVKKNEGYCVNDWRHRTTLVHIVAECQMSRPELHEEACFLCHVLLIVCLPTGILGPLGWQLCTYKR